MRALILLLWAHKISSTEPMSWESTTLTQYPNPGVPNQSIAVYQ